MQISKTRNLVNSLITIVPVDDFLLQTLICEDEQKGNGKRNFVNNKQKKKKIASSDNREIRNSDSERTDSN